MRDHEAKVIEQLSSYKQIVSRMKVLEKYPVGNGITVSRLNQDDHLQELHRQLRGMPSYLYLTKREQELEAVAHAYLDRYPAGTQAQLRAVPGAGVDDEDSERLQTLRRKIQRIIEARTGHTEGYEAVLEQLAEYQDLQTQLEKIDSVLDVMGEQNANLVKLLRIRYIEGETVTKTADKMFISRRTFYNWNQSAIDKYAELAGFK